MTSLTAATPPIEKDADAPVASGSGRRNAAYILRKLGLFVLTLWAAVTVNFVYGKSSCAAKDGTALTYKILLAKVGDKWLIDDVIFDDSSRLTEAFAKAAKIK